MISGREENDRRNYFMINLHESMGPGRDRTRDPWICSQTRICCQTRYGLRYAARSLFSQAFGNIAEIASISAFRLHPPALLYAISSKTTGPNPTKFVE